MLFLRLCENRDAKCRGYEIGNGWIVGIITKKENKNTGQIGETNQTKIVKVNGWTIQLEPLQVEYEYKLVKQTNTVHL